ncbi:flagellar basal body L-ring protein FlgH [Rhizobium sp. FKL33]|uniref:flagellar basal body L-ring protein FlgH n=1 Tax=Rhizobium sp. FKL33 TaxID=2562307 RepID=UPI0010BF73A5|nr:flagellar basal body L-ring protein FlgH [Rhizobium sp. FKL33]
MNYKLFLMAGFVVVAGCNAKSVKELNRAPAMSPIGTGLQFTKTNEMGQYPKQPSQIATGYSLWSDSKAALFKDARALKVGDILTVTIEIDDSATFDNKTDRSRDTSWKKGYSVSNTGIIKDIEADGSLSNSSSSSSTGDGSIERKEKLSLQLAVVVTGVLDNGNLLISGSQEVRVNQEIRVLNLAGIVRPQDVDADNKLSYDKIAEARISYGGRGRLSEIQNPPVGQQAVDIFGVF